MTGSAAVVGAGILGRLVALLLRRRGWRVTLFDRGGPSGRESCSFAAAGMLAPYCELQGGEPLIARLGLRALEVWPQLLATLSAPVFFQREGSLVVAHPTDLPELECFRKRLAALAPHAMREVQGESLRALEPELDVRLRAGIFLPGEGQIDNRALLPSLAETLAGEGVECRFGVEVTAVRAHAVDVGSETHRADWIVDCGGLDSRRYLPGLRGVRGELIVVKAPEVEIHRPVRLMHPRYPLYLVPRPESRYLVGATCLETEDGRPITVRSALELLSASFALHPGLADATIEAFHVGCRPAFADNLPRVRYQRGCLFANGLYRHGYLLSPVIAEAVAAFLDRAFLDREGVDADTEELFEEVA